MDGRQQPRQRGGPAGVSVHRVHGRQQAGFRACGKRFEGRAIVDLIVARFAAPVLGVAVDGQIPDLTELSMGEALPREDLELVEGPFKIPHLEGQKAKHLEPLVERRG
jgi:hypothetical protein